MTLCSHLGSNTKFTLLYHIHLTPLHFCACPKPGLWFPTSYVMVISMFNKLKWEVIVHFVEVDGSFDSRYLNFLFIVVRSNNAKGPKWHSEPTSHSYWVFILFIVFNATFSNISAMSWRPDLVVEEAGVPGENHRPWASNW